MAHWSQWIAYGVLAVVLIIAAVIDARTTKVPNRLTFPAILFGLLYWPIIGAILAFGATPDGGYGWSVIGEHTAATWIGFLAGLLPFMILILSTGGLGPGDMKLMGAIGAISASWQVVLATVFYGLLVCLVYAIVLMIKTGRTKLTFQRLFGAALMAGAGAKAELDEDEKSPKVPYAVGACIGGLLAGAEVMLGLPTPWAAF